MPGLSPALCVLTLVLATGVLVLIGVCLNVKFRVASARWIGVRVYDFGADLNLPPTRHSRSYQIALYLTMKSLPREPIEPQSAPRISARAASR